jgi:hypothetical protein
LPNNDKKKLTGWQKPIPPLFCQKVRVVQFITGGEIAASLFPSQRRFGAKTVKKPLLCGGQEEISRGYPLKGIKNEKAIIYIIIAVLATKARKNK